jgi:hypothetical protein
VTLPYQILPNVELRCKFLISVLRISQYVNQRFQNKILEQSLTIQQHPQRHPIAVLFIQQHLLWRSVMGLEFGSLFIVEKLPREFSYDCHSDISFCTLVFHSTGTYTSVLE